MGVIYKGVGNNLKGIIRHPKESAGNAGGFRQIETGSFNLRPGVVFVVPSDRGVPGSLNENLPPYRILDRDNNDHLTFFPDGSFTQGIDWTYTSNDLPAGVTIGEYSATLLGGRVPGVGIYNFNVEARFTNAQEEVVTETAAFTFSVTDEPIRLGPIAQNSDYSFEDALGNGLNNAYLMPLPGVVFGETEFGKPVMVYDDIDAVEIEFTYSSPDSDWLTVNTDGTISGRAPFTMGTGLTFTLVASAVGFADVSQTFSYDIVENIFDDYDNDGELSLNFKPYFPLDNGGARVTTKQFDFQIGNSYSEQLELAFDTQAEYIWEVAFSSELPEGMILSTEGLLSGTPTGTDADFNVSLKLTHIVSGLENTELNLFITIRSLEGIG